MRLTTPACMRAACTPGWSKTACSSRTRRCRRLPPARSWPGRSSSPELVSFISYPYEWSFSQLKDAALLTLKIQKRAIQHGLSLKDASAYNIQFQHGRPLLIDTLSFEIYPEGQPWVAYRQFCQHFLAPLALMAHVDVRLGQLLRLHIDGIPLDLASRLLPARTRFSIPLLHPPAPARRFAKALCRAGRQQQRKGQ